ncbi:MAG: hypothetical protein U0452_10055 [Anaerolineae bacterium]
MRENVLAETLSLNGQWRIEIGEDSGPVTVPGAWEKQGYTFLPDCATYQRSITVPESWAGAQIWMQFGAVSYHVEVRVNEILVGTHEGLWTAFERDVTEAVRFGDSNTVELRITKPGIEGQTFPYREVLGGFLPYTAMAFGGPWQPMNLVAFRAPAIAVESVKADWHTGRITIAAHAEGPGSDTVQLRADVTSGDGQVVASLSPESSEAPFDVQLDQPEAWSPAHPALYTVRLTLERNGSVVAETSRQVGFRALEAQGEQLLLNGTAFNVRGLLSWGWDPDTLAPAPSDEAIRDEFRRVRMMGFNLVKLCLFVPPPRVYEIADEEGMLLWLELPLWWQRTTDHLRHQVRVEYADILRAVQFHPSIVLYSLGCELDADMADGDMLSALSDLARNASCGSLLCDNSGSGEAYAGLNTDFADFADYHFYCDLHYFTPLLDHFRRDWRRPRPWIFGEFCDSDTYRDPAVIDASGRPWWRDLYGVEGNPNRWAYPKQEELVAALGLPFSGAELTAISRRQSLVIRKAILERTRSRREVGGYVLTKLRDTPVGTSGVFDDFGMPKFDPNEFRLFNADNVLLLDQGRARRWIASGDRPAPRDLHNHFSGATVTFRFILAQLNAVARTELVWRLVAQDGQVFAGGTRPIATWPQSGPPAEIASLELTLPHVDQPSAWTLEASIEGVTNNRWPLWIYPPVSLELPGITAYDPAGQFGGRWPEWSTGQPRPTLLMAGVYDAAVEAFVRAGGRVILLQPDGGRLPSQPLTFWREAINLLYDHPVLKRLPHQGYTDLQFYHLAADHALESAALAGMTPLPVIRRLDARLFSVKDYLLDLRPGDGHMLASTLHFFGGAGDQVRRTDDKPAAVFLLHEMMRYLLESSGV